MSFTWNELVGIGLIKFLQDPELVLYFLRILKPLRRDFLDDEYRSSYLGWDDQKDILDRGSELVEVKQGGSLGTQRDILLSHNISSLKMRKRIIFFRDNSIIIHPIIEWRKGNMSYEEASTYFLNGGSYSGLRSASFKEKIYSIEKLLTEPLMDHILAMLGHLPNSSMRGRMLKFVMIDGGPGEGMPDQLPDIPFERVNLKLCII